MTLSWDSADERVVVEVFPFTEEAVVEPGTPEEEIEEPEPEEILVVRLPAGLARAFSKRAAVVVSAGRAPCPFCGGPLDPSGHLCPRANGFRRTATARGLTRLDPDVEAEALPPRRGRDRGPRSCRRPTRPSSAPPPSAGTSVAVRLQAGRGGAAAVGLPRRHPGRPRGRGVRRLRGARLGRRAADRAARRPGRPRHGAGLARARRRPGPGRPGAHRVACRRATCTCSTPTTATTGRSRWCTRTATRCAGWRSSTCWSTTPTARAATCWR